MILGVGTDLVNIERVRKVLDRFGDRFEKRVFSELEIERSRRKYDPSSSYAKRWAAKEACSKALGIGLRMGISWKEMHIVNLRSGKPELILEGKAKDFPVYMKNLRKQYAIRSCQLANKKTKLSEVLECITQKKN